MKLLIPLLFVASTLARPQDSSCPAGQVSVEEKDCLKGSSDDEFNGCCPLLNVKNLCSNHKNFACVDNSKCPDPEFDIRTDQISNLDPYDAFCEKPGQKCCSFQNIKPSCQDEQYHECVPENLCFGGLKSSFLAEGPDPAKSFCPTGYKCCHQDNIQAEAEADPTEQCSSNVFGKCVSKERCAKNIETFTKKTCDPDGEVCCSKKWVKPDEKPCQNSCVADDRCLDSNDVLKDAGKCSGTDVCCQNVAPEVVEPPADTKTCEDNTGFACRNVDQCDKMFEGSLTKDQGNVINTDQLCSGDQKICCTEKTKPPITPKDTKYEPRCGQRHIQGLGPLQLNPQDKEVSTQIGEWPHSCILYKNNEFIGGASILAPGVAVTTASKVVDFAFYGKGQASDYSVRCGDWDRNDDDEAFEYQERTVSEMVQHPRYNHDKIGSILYRNNIAVLFFDEEFNLDKHIDTICLPDVEPNYEESDCFVTGWGKKTGNGDYQDAMKQIRMDLQDRDTCLNNIRSFAGLKYPQRYKLDDSKMCAYSPDKDDTCYGDGGGALVCKDKNQDRYLMAGLTSQSVLECGQENVPGLYVSVSHERCFISYVTKCKKGDKYQRFINNELEACKTFIDDEIKRSEAEEEISGFQDEIRKLKDQCE